MSGATQSTVSDVDLFSDQVADNPYPVYRQLRDAGGAVYMSKHDFYALTRYDDVRAADGDWQTYTSSRGVALLPQFNAMQIGNVLATDPPKHDALRAILAEQVSPRAIRKLTDDINRQADELVRAAVAKGEFDAVTDLAQKLPISVVADLIGLPDEGRDRLIPGADAFFATFGPMTPALEEKLPHVQAFQAWMTTVSDRAHLRPGSWGTAILDAVDEGRLASESAFPLMRAFLVAGMDTTVNGIGAMIRVLAERPDVWAALREHPSLASAAFEEALRTESPVQAFFRETTRDVEVDGTLIPAGSRVCLHFGSANRDERHFTDPDDFDLNRGSLDHLAFGHGTHSCAGQGLARLEARALISALLRNVETIELAGTPERHYNAVVRGLGHLPVVVRPREGQS